MPTKEELLFAQKVSNYNELKDIVIALIQGDGKARQASLFNAEKKFKKH